MIYLSPAYGRLDIESPNFGFILESFQEQMKATRIVFLETAAKEKRIQLCRVVEHFFDLGKMVQIVVDSTMAAQNIDQFLWTFSQGSFVPHKLVSLPPSQNIIEPVAITVGEIPLQGFDTLVMDEWASLETIKRYALAVHFVLMDDSEKRLQSRMYWQSAKEQGFEMKHLPAATKLKDL
jgi:DNA polymerase III subunit chi